MSDEMSPSSSRDNDQNYPLRRQSAVSDFKPKVSDFFRRFCFLVKLYNVFTDWEILYYVSGIKMD